MPHQKPHSQDTQQEWEHAIDDKSSSQRYILRLYVTGITPRSLRAIENIKNICEVHLQGRYELEIVDIYQQPVLAKGDQIIAAPTLIKLLPLPLRRFIGDMSQKEKILLGLDLQSKRATTPNVKRRSSSQ